MNALVVLYRLQGRAVLRRVVRGAGTVKGALLFLFGVAVVGLWLGPSIWFAFSAVRTDPREVLDVAPVFLLAACFLAVIASGGEKAIAFTPAEVDFLFPGPFTRRQLLLFKLGKAAAGVMFSSLLLSAVLLRHASGWVQCYLALCLAMMFLQLFGMAFSLLGHSVGERAYTRTRKGVIAVIVIAVLVGVMPHLKGGGPGGFAEAARAMRSSEVGRVLLWPLEAFGELFAARAWWPEGLRALGLAVLWNAVLVFVVFWLDADYLEAAVVKSQALHDRLARVRKGGLTAVASLGKRAGRAAPMLPYWGGAGPVAWRQGTSAIRHSRSLLFILLILCVGAGPVAYRAEPGKDLAGPLIGVMAWLTVIVSGWLRFDFRGDLDQLDYLKSLPASPRAVAAGQLVAPVVLMTLCHWLLVVGVSVAARRVEEKLVAAAVLALPFNVILFEVENAIFLWFPTRAAANPADFQGYGRQILVLFAKMLILVLIGGVAALAGFVVHTFTGSWGGTIGVVFVVLAGVAAAGLPVVGWAFGRFDVSGEMPN